jgi:hypothetical protein
VLLAYGECRHAVAKCVTRFGDGCKDVCARRSTDSGASFGALEVLARHAGQNTAVWDAAAKRVILQFVSLRNGTRTG